MTRPRGKVDHVAPDAHTRSTTSEACAARSTIHDWTIASDIAHIQPVVDAIVVLCRGSDFSERHCRLNVPVAVTEALANAILRGNESDAARLVSVHVVLDERCLQIDVSDQGTGFDLSAVHQSPAEADWFEREDGRGVFLMRQLMDRVESVRAPGAGHCLRLILHRT